MTANNPSGLNGALNGAQQPHSSSRRLPDTSRPLTFREALPFYPQTNSLPFVPDLIPNPKVDSYSSALSTLDVLPPTDLQNLNDEANVQGHLTRDGKQAVEGVLYDLKASSSRTRYKFIQTTCAPPDEIPGRSLSQGLSPCAKAIFDRVGGFFIDKSASPSTSVINGVAKTEASPVTPINAHGSNQSVNANAHRSNSTRIEVAIPSKKFDPSAYTDMASQSMPMPMPMPTPTTQMNKGQVPHQPIAQKTETPVPIPNYAVNARAHEVNKGGFRIEFAPTNINRDEYVEVQAPLEAPTDLSRRKDGQTVSADVRLLGETPDQRQRADAAVSELRRRIESINRATRAAYEMEPGFDNIVTLNADQEPTLTAEEHKKMLSSMQKVVGFGRFSTVPVEDLSQILKLSESSLKEGSTLEVQIDKDWDETSVTNWLQQSSAMETALKAARTSLRIITGGREDRQLYSESVIESSIRVFQKAADEIIIPLVELRNSGGTGSVFKALAKHKKDIATIFVTCQKLLGMLAELVSKVQVTDLPLNTLEFVASNLVFVENAQYEKDSLIGIQKFDGIRSGAMDVLCQIFLVKPEQRQGILNEILTSLSKLPVTRQGSRQFKLAEGGSIQPVSALLMRLVQASSAGSKTDAGGRPLQMLETDADEDDTDVQRRSTAAATVTSEKQAADQPDIAIQDLSPILENLAGESFRNATMVTSFLVNRAASSSKTGDTPFRNLLDLCVEDFITCMDAPAWPAAELLLRSLMSHMVHLFEGERTAAPVKNMALEILGNLTSAISRVRSQTKRQAASLQTSESTDLSNFLVEVALNQLGSSERDWQSLSWTGPFRVVLESVLSRNKGDAHLEGAASFIMSTWAQRVSNYFNKATAEDDPRDQELGRLAFRLRMMIEDRTWLTSQFEFNAVSNAQEKLSYATILLDSPLCDAFSPMLNILLRSMTSDQATVRSKSLKSVSHVLDTDPSILDKDPHVLNSIKECVEDSSTQVRDSALSLLGSCIGLRPALEDFLAPDILRRFPDTGVMVRKRAMKLARDIYLRNGGKTLRAQISAGLLRRVNVDTDESAREAARQMVEEIWFAPFYRQDDSAAFQTAVADHTLLIIRTAMSGGLDNVLNQVFKTMLKPGATGPFSVCSKLVANLFDRINDPPSDDLEVPSGQDALYVLTIFAQAKPKLFTFEQIRLLKPMIEGDELINIKQAKDIDGFKFMMIILKRVLPQLSTVHQQFITDLKQLLQKRISKISFREPLNELVECQSVVCKLLNDNSQMVRVARGCLNNIHKTTQPSDSATSSETEESSGPRVIEDAKDAAKVKAWANIAATIYRFFDLEPALRGLRQDLPMLADDSVGKMLINLIEPLASPKQLPDVELWLLQCIAIVCQASPRLYTMPKVWGLFQQIFKRQQPDLENAVIESFRSFLTTEERRSEAKAELSEAKSLTVMGGTNYDDVASATTQRFLNDIARVALEGQTHYSLTAVEVLGSINRQGLTHPKEIGVTMITLETSANKAIADLAFREHKLLHGKHESTMEREYSKAIQEVYVYQRDIVGDTRGANVDSKEPRAKLHNMIDVLKISKMKNRQRLFEKICALIDFDLSALDSSPEMPPHFDFTRFVMDNLAYIEYQTVGELQTTVHELENIFTNIGTGVAQAIESEVFGVRVDLNPEAQQLPPQEANPDDAVQQQLQQQLNGEARGAQAIESPTNIDDGRLRQLAVAANILLIVWETRTYLRKLYGMGSSRQDTKAKALAKDLNRTPTKVQGYSWEAYWDQATSIDRGLYGRENWLVACQYFIKVMNYDSDIKVTNEDDDDMALDPATPSDGGGDDVPDGRGRKRKNNSTPGGRKKRQRSTSQLRKRGRPRKNTELAGNDDSDMDWA